MSGSGGSGINTDFITSVGGPIGAACRSLAFDANIASPDPDVARDVQTDDVLAVTIVGDPPQIALITEEGGQLGSLTAHWGDLTKCTDQGFEYEAIVLGLDPAIRVHVQLRR